ncbi:MAG: flagellar biosynthesis anti-sigma factor FlgM [Congregibacter sp.]|nr:flagellar biosynthesis anti-sigma factor FlgM [Congregibacter sp.]MDP5071643.1 flagellar biosynthesis anti-sigma factor FlgM [Congregibacter sp.]
MNPVDNNISIRQTRNDASKASGGAEQATPGGAAAGSPAAQSSASGESVSITNTAAELLSLENQLRDLPGIDQARVDSIREAIGNGSYEVDPVRIVDSLLQSEVEFG